MRRREKRERGRENRGREQRERKEKREDAERKTERDGKRVVFVLAPRSVKLLNTAGVSLVVFELPLNGQYTIVMEKERKRERERETLRHLSI